MRHPKQKPRPKPVTSDDYRRDRDYWQQLATTHQRTIDSIKNREYTAQHESSALLASRNYFRAELQKLCPHAKPEHIGDVVRCGRCKKNLGRSHPKKRSETS